MLEYPANSAGDLFRLLPFEGYMSVLSFLPVTCLAAAARVSRGWRFAVRCRGAHDLSITCTTTSQLKEFLELLFVPNLGVSSISCDIGDIAGLEAGDDGDDGDASTLWATLWRCLDERQCPQIFHVTWRCKSFDGHAYQSTHILRSFFPNLKSLKVDFAVHPLDKIRLPGHSTLFHLSVVNSGSSRRKLVTDLHGVHWTGHDLPVCLRSLSLEGVSFAHAERGNVNFLYFLQNCPNLQSLRLDVHDGWWKKCGSRFRRGIVGWIKSRPEITHFYMKQLSQARHLEIQELLRERRERLSDPRSSRRIRLRIIDE